MDLKAQSNNSSRELFVDALNRLCGEANEAARQAKSLLVDGDLSQARRELARILEIVEMRLMPIADRVGDSVTKEADS
jgi:hypothetical protein